MRKIFMSLLLVALVMAMGATAYAVDYEGPEDLYVSYDGEDIESNLDTEDLFDQIQPGDSATVEIEIRNDAEGSTDWWMHNGVVENFEKEENEATGGAYTYTLTYTDKSGEENVIYSSENVGGDEGQADGDIGLKEATGALEDYFFLETLEEGDTAKVKLYVALDGETQGNAYQETLAQIEFMFGVEPEEEPEPVIIHVKTGDTTTLMPYIALLGGGLILLIGVLVFGRKKAEEK